MYKLKLNSKILILEQESRGRRNWPRLIGPPLISLLFLFLLLWAMPAQAAFGLSQPDRPGETARSTVGQDQLWPTDRPAPAAIPALQGSTSLAVSIISSPWAPVDSNGVPGAGDGSIPEVFVVEAVITNTGPNPAVDLLVDLDFNSGGGWALLSGEQALRSLDQLGPGQAYHAYWLATYPQTIGSNRRYTVTARADNASPVLTANNSYGNPAPGATVQTKSYVSTGNSGLGSISTEIIVGLAFTVTQVYDLGSNPQKITFSPVGNADFDPGAYRLLSAQVRFYNDAGTQQSIVNDRLYFPTLPAFADNAEAIYTFIALTPTNTLLCSYAAIQFNSQSKYDNRFCSLDSGTAININGTLTLDVSKQVSSLTTQQGRILTYTINYANNGSNALQFIWLWDDVLTDVVSIIPASISPASDPDETTESRVAWNIGMIPAFGSGTLRFSVLVDGNGQDLVDGTAVVNRAFLGVNPGSLPPRAALTRTVTTIVQAPTVTVSKTDGATTAKPGDPLVYTLRITNSGSIPARALVINDVLPAQVSPSGPATPPATSQVGQTLIWNNLGPIAANGATLVINIPVTVAPQAPDGAALTNLVQVKYENNAAYIFATKTDTDLTTVQAPVLTITKRDFPDPVLTGKTILYTLNYTNSGSGQATNLLITDVVPLNTTYQNCSGGSSCGFDSGTGIVSWAVSALPSGGSGAVSFSVLVTGTLQTGDEIFNGSYGIRADQTPFVSGPLVTTLVNRDAAFIDGYAFDDADGDGVRDGGEAGIAGVVITLTQAVTPVLTTDVNGYYRFRVEEQIPVTVSASLPGGFFRTSPGEVVYLVSTLGMTKTINFGYASTASGFGVIFGTVFEDKDQDGTQDLGENGLSGVSIASAEAAASPVTTNEFGHYTLRYNSSGAVTITETDPPFYVSTTPNVVNTTATVGSSGPSPIDFGDFQGIQISGQVFHDTNVNGINDDGAGVAGAAVRAGNVSVTTTSSGIYTLYLKPTGPVTITETDPAGYLSTAAVAGPGLSELGVNTLRIDSPVSGNTYNGDFGDLLASAAITISGQVWEDNGAGGGGLANGQPDGTEPGLSGAVVSLSSGLSATTGPDGLFSVLGPADQIITVTETNPGGYVSTNAIAGSSASKVDNDTLVVAPLSGGSTSTDNLFGDVLQTEVALISGLVFDDANENGDLDGGEAGLAGVTITVEIQDGPTFIVASDSSGAYQVPVAPGSNVRLTSGGPGGGYYPTRPEMIVLNLTGPGEFAGNDFGYSDDTDVAVIMGLAFDDQNGDGVQDFGELGLAGATITLDGGQTQTTDVTGRFAYAVSTAQQSYTVAETDPPGYRSTTPNQVNVWVNALGQSYLVTFGDTNSATTSTIYGTVFDDLNGDGQQNAAELGLAGVVVTVTFGINDFSLTTNVYGQYSYATSTGGIHAVQEQNPIGYRSTTPDHINVVVALGQSYEVNFGDVSETNTSFSTIMGLVFDDDDGDGLQDFEPTEPGIAGVTVALSDGQTTTTDANGSYTFALTNLGFVNVVETDPPGYHSTTPNSVTVEVALLGQTYTVNFGDSDNAFVSSFFGTVFLDQNSNSVRDLNDPGLSDVTVAMTGFGPVTTNQWGQYTFLIENMGSYTITETDPPDFVSTNAIPGDPAVTKVDNNTFRVAVNSLGTDFGDNQFGDIPILSIDCGQDPYEADDIADQAQALVLGSNQLVTQGHNFHLPGDQDWLRLTLQPGAAYTFATSNLGSLADTQLILYADDATTVLAQNDDIAPTNPASRLEWTAPLLPLDQIVYLVVRQPSGSAFGCDTNYTLSLEQSAGGNLDNVETSKSVDPDEPIDLSRGDPVIYTITLHNTDTRWVAPVVVTDTLPVTITLKSLEFCQETPPPPVYMIYLPIVVQNTSAQGRGAQFSSAAKVAAPTDSHYLEYSLVVDEGNNSFTWVGALGPGAQVSLCVTGEVAQTPWDSTNTAWISWNDQTISRSATGSSSDEVKIYLPIVIK